MENYQDTNNTLGYKWVARKYSNSLLTYTKWTDCHICGQEGILPHLPKCIVWDLNIFVVFLGHAESGIICSMKRACSHDQYRVTLGKSAVFWAFLLPHLLMFMIRDQLEVDETNRK